MPDEDELGLMQFFKAIADELPKLRASIDKLSLELGTLRSVDVTDIGTIMYDLLDKLEELKEVIKWYAERSTYQTYLK